MADNLDPVPTQRYGVSSVALSQTTATLAFGGTVTLTATAKDASNVTVGGVNFTWVSRNPSVATVNQSGVVTAYAGRIPNGHKTAVGGVAQIYVYVQRADGSLTEIKNYATITVNGV